MLALGGVRELVQSPPPHARRRTDMCADIRLKNYRRYSGPSWRGASNIGAQVSSSGTVTPSATTSWLPVPRRPAAFQLSTISPSDDGNYASRQSGRPGGTTAG
jgi:hypothetical protein